MGIVFVGGSGLGLGRWAAGQLSRQAGRWTGGQVDRTGGQVGVQGEGREGMGWE